MKNKTPISERFPQALYTTKTKDNFIENIVFLLSGNTIYVLISHMIKKLGIVKKYN